MYRGPIYTCTYSGQGRIQRVLLGGLWRTRESNFRGDEVPLKLTRFCNSKFKFLIKNAPFLRNLNRIHHGPGAKPLVRGSEDEVPLKQTRFCDSKFKFLMKNALFYVI